MRFQKLFLQKWREVLFVVLFSLSLSACQSSTGDVLPESPPDTTPPTIESSIPEGEAVGVEVDTAVRVVFSELMNESTLIDGGLQLYSGKITADATEELEPREEVLTFSSQPGEGTNLVTGLPEDIEVTVATLTTPTGRFSLNTAYTVILDKPASDLREDDLETEEDERNVVLTSLPFNFTTEAGQWEKSTQTDYVKADDDGDLAVLNLDQHDPITATNSKGDAVLVWRQNNESGISQIWVSHYNANSEEWFVEQDCENVQGGENCEGGDVSEGGQGSIKCVTGSVCRNTERLDIVDGNRAFNPRVSMNAHGHIVVTWVQVNQNSNDAIWAAIFNGSEWLTATEISDESVSIKETPEVAIADDGVVVAVWRELDQGIYKINSSTYTPSIQDGVQSGRWNAPTYVNKDAMGDSRSPQVQMSSDGLVMALWVELIQEEYKVSTSSMKHGSQTVWAQPQIIDSMTDSGKSKHASFPKIQIDGHGDAMAIWQKSDGQRDNVWYNRFVTGSWGVAARLEDDRRGDAAGVGVSVSVSNHYFAYWYQDVGTGTVLMVQKFHADTGWEDAVEVTQVPVIAEPKLVFDREGNAMAIWKQFVPSGVIYASSYSKISNTWGTPTVLSFLGGNSLTLSSLYEDGRMLAVWLEFNGSRNRLTSTTFTDGVVD